MNTTVTNDYQSHYYPLLLLNDMISNKGANCCKMTSGQNPIAALVDGTLNRYK